jgi:5-methylthioribose kinase
MRALNHLHVFDLPFRPDNGLDLDAVLPGLAAVARALHTDAGLLRRIHALGERYLTDGPTLLHGDFYPGSWLNTERGVRVIDPEFAFCGPASFDWGVLIAHLLLTDQPHARVEAVAARAPQEALGFAGVEVLRRLLGVAQLPLTADLDTRRAWVGRAVAWVFEGTPA